MVKEGNLNVFNINYMSADKSFHICLKLWLGWCSWFLIENRNGRGLVEACAIQNHGENGIGFGFEAFMVAPFKLDNIIHQWHESSRCPLGIKCDKHTIVGFNATALKLEFSNDARSDACASGR